MIRKALISAAALAAVATPLALAATPAEAAAANPSCASRAEFSRIRVGMPVRTTQTIIGSPGQVSMAGSFMSQRQWRVCGSPYSWVTLTYMQGRLDNKILL
jgi:hypothetical protein